MVLLEVVVCVGVYGVWWRWYVMVVYGDDVHLRENKYTTLTISGLIYMPIRSMRNRL